MTNSKEERQLRRIIAILRITLGIIILATWWDNLQKGIYSAEGITDLFTHPDWGIFTNGGGALPGYRSLIENTILQAPGVFAVFQMVAELLMGLGLFFGLLTPVAGAGATVFFVNLFLAYLGNSEEWIWIYVLLAVSALVVTLARSGRVWGIDAIMYRTQGRPKPGFLW
jgi:thiosulfate dehydrogenase [quinone] large subunit